MYMGQLNMHMSPAFEQTLKKFMRARGIKSKSEAIRVAVEEGLLRASARARPAQFGDWLGLGKHAPENPRPRFASDDDLWR